MDSTTLFDLTGKVALVTGASRGLGRTFALALARAGADVAITSRTLASLDGTKKEVEALGRRCFATVLDVHEPDALREQLAALGEALVATYGRPTGSGRDRASR